MKITTAFSVLLLFVFSFGACDRDKRTVEEFTVEEFIEHFESLQFLIDSPLLYQGNWSAEVLRPDERTNNFEDYVLRCFYADTLDDDSVVCRSYCNLQNIKTLKWYWDTNSVDSVILHKFWKIDTSQYCSYVNTIASMIWEIISGYHIEKISFFEGSICVFSSYNGWDMITFRPYASQRVLNSIEHLNDCYSEEDAKYIRLDSTNYWVRKYKAK